MSEQELLIELRRVRDALKRRDPNYSMAALRLLERECLAELAKFTTTGGTQRLLSEVQR
jgi:hypothetical protein